MFLCPARNVCGQRQSALKPLRCVLAFIEKSAYEESVSDRVSADTVTSHEVPFHTPKHAVLIASPWGVGATGLVQQRGVAQDLLTRSS